MKPGFFRRVTSQNAARLAVVFLLALIAVSILGPLLVPGGMEHSTTFFQPPSKSHWLGTNDVGQDILTRILLGARASLLVVAGVAFLATSISIALGASAGLIGGGYDRVLMRLVDAFLVLPPMILVILFSVYFYPGNKQFILFISLLTWPAGARVLRSQALALKNRSHILAAQTFGAGTFYLIKRHIIPDLGPVIAATFVQSARNAVFMEAAMAFLGITDPGRVSWGKELYQALTYVHLNTWLWWLLPVGILISLTLLSFTFIGYSVEEALDPRLRREKHA